MTEDWSGQTSSNQEKCDDEGVVGDSEKLGSQDEGVGRMARDWHADQEKGSSCGLMMEETDPCDSEEKMPSSQALTCLELKR